MMSSHSEITTPSKPSSSRSTPVISSSEAWTGTPFTAPELIITVSAPASMPRMNEGRCSSRSSRSVSVAFSRSRPLSGAE